MILIDFDVISATRPKTDVSTFFDLGSIFMVYLERNQSKGLLNTDTKYDYLIGLLEFLQEARGNRSHQALLESFFRYIRHALDKWMD